MVGDDPEELKKLMAKLLQDAKRSKLLEVAQQLIQQYKIKTIAGKKNDTIYNYNDGTYHPNAETVIRQECEDLLMKNCTNHAVSEVMGHIKRKTYTKEKDLKVSIELINVKNGILNIKERTLEKHSDIFFFTSQTPVTYKPEAKCPNFSKFLEETLYSEDIPVMQEFIGYCLYKRYFIKKALICVGQPDTGKTTLIKAMTIFLGPENVSSESLQKIVYDRFSAANLHGKSANIYDDLPYQDINEAGGFKIATGGGYLAAEEKFGDRWQYINHAKLMFACNQIPRLRNINDPAYYDRWMIIRFSNVRPKKEQDLFLIDKITTEEELSGILNWALDGLGRLFTENCFSYALDAEQNKEIMIRNSEPISAFVSDCLVQSDGDAVPKAIVYELYKYHARINKLAVETKTMLTQQLSKFASHIVIDGQRRFSRKVYECYINTKCKDYQDFITTQCLARNNNYDIYGFFITPDNTDTPSQMCSKCGKMPRKDSYSSVCLGCFSEMKDKPSGQERLDV